MIGCGRLVKTTQSAAFQTGVSRGTSTSISAMASPSGTLWNAIAVVMKA